ncbi:enoyl-CoA hydratase/isomerase family protein [Nitriliruptoraceae bacterium ZYF776]|nr:enoyl-CoA hydratase/isomerase family protein [Profundirhabdus halotolerans]
MSYDHLLVEELPGDVRVLTLARPEKLNAWNGQMRREMRAAIEDAAHNPGLRCLIITGAGRAFSAGEDVAGMADLAAIGTRGFRAVARQIHDVFDVIEAAEIPVVAAIDGIAAGGGFELALSCDFRVVSEASRLIMPEARVGLIPGSGGCSRLIKHVGLGRAKELVMLGGSVSPDRAYELGLATDVVPAGEALAGAVRLAERIAQHAPLAVGMAKLILNTCTDVDAETGRRLERLGQSVLKTTEDHQEGATAFLEKRAAKWQGR